MHTLSEIQFKNEFVTNFDGDDSGNIRPRQTPRMLYSKALPTTVKEVTLLAWSEDLANELEIEKPGTTGNRAEEDVNILGGNHIVASMQPYAACYAGHQFGNWAGQLGDGRAITLGEVQTSSGKTYELQLKGAGRTAYSRTADGRAVLRSSVREYLMSEAMYYLGVPTTRALSLVNTGEQILRDMFYNGNPAYEPGAIVMRVAPTFLRFGNYEMLAARKEIPNLEKLVNWTIDHYFPHIKGENKVLAWYKEIVDRTAALMVEWQRVGFVHGVMNTDNMSILGITIDYGPYSFVDDYDPKFTPNTTDLPGRRYAFGKQAAIAKWNLSCLAGAISLLINDDTRLKKTLATYDDVYRQGYHVMMANKLGFDEVSQENIKFIKHFEKMLKVIKPDMTIFFQLLIELSTGDAEQDMAHHFRESFYVDLKDNEKTLLKAVMSQYIGRIKDNTISRKASADLMRKNNPRLILRNYLLHQAIEQMRSGSNALFLKLQEAIKDPYSNRFDEFFAKRPGWATKAAGCSMLSCSS